MFLVRQGLPFRGSGIQNESYGFADFWNVSQNIHRSPFMADETRDMSNREKVVMYDDNLLPHEYLIGLHKVDCINVATRVRHHRRPSYNECANPVM